MNLLSQLSTSYRSLFHTAPLLICSPGRVNLIGEHTDYNEGFVLPAAIDKAIYLAIGLREDDELHFVAHDLTETFDGSLNNLSPTTTWADYLLGVLAQFRLAGHAVKRNQLRFWRYYPHGCRLVLISRAGKRSGFCRQ